MGQTYAVITGSPAEPSTGNNKERVLTVKPKEMVRPPPKYQRMRVTGWGLMQHLDVVWSTSREDKTLDSMRNVTFLPDGGVAVCVPELKTVKRFHADGGELTQYSGTVVRPLVPTGVAWSMRGHLLVLCDNEYTKGMREFDLTAPYRHKRSHDKQYMDSVGVAVSSSTGAWVVAEAGEQRCVNVMRPDGKRIRHFGDKHLHSPSGVAVDAMDRIYVTDVHEHAVYVFAMDSSFLFRFGRHGDGDGEFDMPLDICIDPENNVYIADHMNDRISVHRADGSFRFHLKSEQPIKRPRGVALDFFSGRLAVTTKDMDWPSVLYVFSLRKEEDQSLHE